MRRVRNYTKKILTVNQVLGLYTRIDTRVQQEPTLSDAAGSFDNKVQALSSAMYTLRRSDITADIEAADNARDNAYTVVYSLVTAAANDPSDTAKQGAGMALKRIMDSPEYRRVAESDYATETAKLINLCEDMLTNRAQEVQTLGIQTKVQALQGANIAFEGLMVARGDEYGDARSRQQVAEAREVAEAEFEFLRDCINYKQGLYERQNTGTVTGTGTGTGAPIGGTLSDLSVCIEAINSFITSVVSAATRRRNAANGSTPTHTNPEGEDPQDGEDEGEDNPNENTDPNQGEDNTPSANA